MALGAFLLLSSVGIVHADTMQSKEPITVKGIVSDNEGPVIGASIAVKEGTTGTITDLNGQFSLTVSFDAVLIVSFVGYTEQQVSVNGRTSLNIKLVEDVALLDEVVVIGYGTARKKDLTGSVAQIKPSHLETTSPTSVQDLLRSGVPGLIVGASNDASGSKSGTNGVGLQIRGQRSLKAGNDPLIVMDNMIYYGSLNEINPLDIEQIDVLKDASSAAIYGAKSANGVIIITTKKGKSAKPVVRFDASLGVSNATGYRKIYDTEGYLKFREDYLSSAQDGFANPGR